MPIILVEEQPLIVNADRFDIINNNNNDISQ